MINSDTLIIFILILSGLGILFIIYKLTIKKCPACKSEKLSTQFSQELDRWRQSVRVTEQLSNGKQRDRHVQKTFIKIKRNFLCNDCHHEWTEIGVEEK